ncbi:BEN domain-containing protein 4-like isoform X1 [Salvelinus fontinalis]|uniref:BEN domain-containing protein 4-like isoform X1 n=1 Tax=Salvelinus fontinalis TaxID=8038 RepID=UPI002485E4EE|nr:BEN domain-containing protein 4-like isoform X1 [Salvelinus fontinalis]
MEGETQPADEGLWAPNMCGQQRGPYSNLKTFPNRRLAGKARFHRPTMVDIPLLGDGGGQNYTHLSHHHPFQQQHQQQRQQLHQTTHTISQRNPTSQLQHNFPCDNRPSSRVATSTSTTVGSVAPASLRLQQTVSRGTTVHRDPNYTGPAAESRAEGRAALKHESPDCVYRISSENRLILDAFAQDCSRVLTLLNGGRFVEPQDPLPSSVTSHIKQEESCLSGPGGESKPDVGQVGHCPTLGKPQPKESSTVDPDEEAQRGHCSQKQTYAFLHIFTKSLQSYLFTGPQQPHPDLGLEGERGPSAESRVSPSNNLGGWISPAPSESYGHPSSTLTEEEEESCCPRCVELEQEMLCLQKENEELRNKLDNIPAPCQNVLDFFKTVLQHHNPFIQPMSQEQQTEEEEQTTHEGSKQLLGNYPLFITNKQWDEAVNSSKKDGRRLLRYLIRFVFTTDELKYSCGLGKRKRSVHSGEPGPERQPLNPVKVTCLREFIRMHGASNPDWWLPSEEQINKVFSDAVGHARQGRSVGECERNYKIML